MMRTELEIREKKRVMEYSMHADPNLDMAQRNMYHNVVQTLKWVLGEIEA